MMNKTLRLLMVSATSLALLDVGLAAAAPTIVVEAEDPDVDDYGPGGYQYPLEPYFLRRGVFDLKRFRVRDDGRDWIFEVEVDRPIDRPIELRATQARYIRFEGEVFFQNFDIYIRTPETAKTADRKRPVYFREAIPGRNFRFSSENEWNHAIVITPYPSHVASLLTDWPGHKATIVPNVVRRIGPRFFVRVPKDHFSNRDPTTWRYAVAVSGAWPLVRDYRRADDEYTNALTMPVRRHPGREHFGGADPGPYNPNVIDLLAPTRARQKELLAPDNTYRRTRFVELPLSRLSRPTAPLLTSGGTP